MRGFVWRDQCVPLRSRLGGDPWPPKPVFSGLVAAPAATRPRDDFRPPGVARQLPFVGPSSKFRARALASGEGGRVDSAFDPEASALWREFAEQTSDFVGISDPWGRVLYLNPAARKRLGVAEATDLTVADFFPSEAITLYYEVIRPQVLRRGAWSGEVPVKVSGGDAVPMYVSTTARLGPGGETHGNVVYAARAAAPRTGRRHRPVGPRRRDRRLGGARRSSTGFASRSPPPIATAPTVRSWSWRSSASPRRSTCSAHRWPSGPCDRSRAG